MTQEYSQHLSNAASFTQEFGETFSENAFDEQSQAVEVFVLQALSMCSSHCLAAALLLQNDFKGEAISVLRSVQELLFDLYWTLQTDERSQQLEKVYQLEADPYAHWDKETRIIEQARTPEFAQRIRGSLDDIASQYPFLTQTDSKGTRQFKTAPSFAARMGSVRPKFYHIYCYSSLFVHPTPTVKRLYLKTTSSEEVMAIDESVNQFVAHTLLFVQLIMRLAEGTIGSFALTGRAKRDTLYAFMVELVHRANKGYFGNSSDNDSDNVRPA